ncbi:MAG: cobalamin transport system ATP-binding protein [bacterium]|nr:cobalamin transport system ATP-binding protein [bacterium]
MLEVRNVYAGYAGKSVIKDITFSLRKGDFLAILGPNGSGKSTIIKVISGILRPLKGSVIFDGLDILSLSSYERARIVATLPQTVRFDFPFSVEEVIAMGRYPYKGKGQEIVEELIQRLHLQELKNRKITSLSGGEFKRVVIAKVLAQTPKILLLDEPLNHLDLKHQAILIELLKEITANGVIVISVFHEINIALRMASFVMLLKDGSTLFFGSPDEVAKGSFLETAFQAKLSRCSQCGSFLPFL